MPEPALDVHDAFVKGALYMLHPPPKGLDSSKKAKDKLLKFQTARDALAARFGKNVKIDLVVSEGNPLKVVAELTLATEDGSLSEAVVKAAQDRGFSVLFQKKNLEVHERISGPAQSDEDSGIWIVRKLNFYVISSSDGSPTSKVENIAETAEALLALADSLPHVLDEEAVKKIAKEVEKERLLEKCHSVAYAVSRSIDWARVLEITADHSRGKYE